MFKDTKSNTLMTVDDATNDIPEFTLNGLQCKAKCVNCYDGDTCKVVFPFNGKLTKWTIRVYGVNTAEIRGGSISEKKKGVEAKEYTRSLILDKIIWIKCYKFEKYGRVVADIYFNEHYTGETLSDLLINNGYSEPYMRTNDI